MNGHHLNHTEPSPEECEVCKLLARVTELEEKLVSIPFCEECGLMFITRAYWQEHLCQGRQGR